VCERPDFAKDLAAWVSVGFTLRDNPGEFALEFVYKRIDIRPGVGESRSVECTDKFSNIFQFQQERTARDEQANGVLNGRGVFDEVKFFDDLKVIQIALECRPGCERNEGGVKDEPVVAQQSGYNREVFSRVSLVHSFQDLVVHGFDR